MFTLILRSSVAFQRRNIMFRAPAITCIIMHTTTITLTISSILWWPAEISSSPTLRLQLTRSLIKCIIRGYITGGGINNISIICFISSAARLVVRHSWLAPGGQGSWELPLVSLMWGILVWSSNAGATRGIKCGQDDTLWVPGTLLIPPEVTALSE